LFSEGVVVSRKPTITYFYTHHKSIIYPFTLNPEEIWNDITKNNAKYIIVDEFSRETRLYLLSFIHEYSYKLQSIYKIGNTELFEVMTL
jgi:hypothetical protein